MREKYVLERFPKYFIFGESKDKDSVDVVDDDGDVAVCVTRENAQSIIEHRRQIVAFMCKMVNAFASADTEAFEAFWYENYQWERKIVRQKVGEE